MKIRMIILVLIAITLLICASNGLSVKAAPSEPIQAISVPAPTLGDYQQWKECVDHCRDECRGSSQPAGCFDRCMRDCTD